MLRRLPIESARPLLLFAATRVAVTLLALVAVIVLGFPYEGRAAAVLGGLLLPWSVGVLLLARRNPDAALSPIVPAVDFLLLAALEAAVPETLGAVRVAALFLVASHAHFQGERRGLAVAAGGSALLVITTQVRGDEPVTGNVLALYEAVFVVSAVATALVVGTLRTAESASRMRARGLSRRTIQAEGEVRRRVAEAIHDGPVQELIGLDMILSAARGAAEHGRGEEAGDLIEEARELAAANVQALRDEILDLGPWAYQELTFAAAIEHCMPTWRRRYGFEVMAAIERVDLPGEMAGDLFRIAQEAVVNAGRHADAQAVSISLRTVDSNIELRVTDNGRGFQEADPLGASEPGHLGLASIRERAELMEGRLEIETSDLGTKVLVLAPMRSESL
ncbi:MAG TPA: ATP-binding protein [Thermoleophilaceae bacterium]|jgi:signal transduction histidine kinase